MQNIEGRCYLAWNSCRVWVVIINPVPGLADWFKERSLIQVTHIPPFKTMKRARRGWSTVILTQNPRPEVPLPLYLRHLISLPKSSHFCHISSLSLLDSGLKNLQIATAPHCYWPGLLDTSPYLIHGTAQPTIPRIQTSTLTVSGYSGARSQHTRSYPWQGHEEKIWQARQIRFSGILKSCPWRSP